MKKLFGILVIVLVLTACKTTNRSQNALQASSQSDKTTSTLLTCINHNHIFSFWMSKEIRGSNVTGYFAEGRMKPFELSCLSLSESSPNFLWRCADTESENDIITVVYVQKSKQGKLNAIAINSTAINDTAQDGAIWENIIEAERMLIAHPTNRVVNEDELRSIDDDERIFRKNAMGILACEDKK